MSVEKTDTSFQQLKGGADRYIKRRNQRLLRNHRKEVRNFTKAEAANYLDINVRTLDKYTNLAGIDPRRHDDAQWSINLEEIYSIRNLLPEELRKEPLFVRDNGMKPQIIVVQNQKGGVGKTVSSATIGSGLATEFHQGYRIGLIDMDGQGTLSMYYAPESAQEGCLSVGDLITGNYELEDGETVHEAISDSFLQTTIPNLRILPASQSDRAIEGWFHEKLFKGEIESPYSLLANIIKEVESEFDIIIIDTPPNLGYATYNAYFAATSVVFPLSVTENDIDATCSYFSYIQQVWELLRNADHPGYDFMKILLTNHKDSSTTTELKNGLSDSFSQFIYSTEFKNSEAVRQASSLLSTVFDMSKSEYPKSKVSFQVAQQNGYEVTSQLHRDIVDVWRNQSRGKSNG